MSGLKRPIPRKRLDRPGSNSHLSFDVNNVGPYGGRNGQISTADLYGERVQRQRLSDESFGESFPDAKGLPSCVCLRNEAVSADQKQRDSFLPQLLFKLDEACKKGSHGGEKSHLAMACLRAASSPLRKYRILHFFELLENNKKDADKFPAALSILEKYANNLLRKEKPVQWKVIKFTASIIQHTVFPVKGAVDVLKQMGYTEATENALTFPHNVEQPDIESNIVLSADLSIARLEVDALLMNEHPFLLFFPDGVPAAVRNSHQASRTRLIETNSSTNDRVYVNEFCGVCSEPNVTIACGECDMQFCEDCDGRWHSHKLRTNHQRSNLSNPAENSSLEKPGRRRPVPVPRQRKSQKSESIEPTYPQISRDYRGLYQSQENLQNVFARTVHGNSMPDNLTYNPSSNPEVRRPPSQSDLSSAMTSPYLTNIHVNPSPAHHSLWNPTYGDFGHDRPPVGYQDPQDSGGQKPGGTYKDELTVSRDASPGEKVVSCANCSALYPASQRKCSSCNLLLVDGQTSRDPKRSPDEAFQRPGFNFGGIRPSAQRYVNGHMSEIARGKSGRGDPDQGIAQRGSSTNVEFPEYPCGPTRASDSVSWKDSVTNEESVYEEIDELFEWNCEHCTALNPIATKVCQVCCRTPSDLQKFPNLVQKPFPSPTTAKSPVPAQNMPGYPGDKRIPGEPYGTGKVKPAGGVLMTPKDKPLEGGVYMSTGQRPPALPARDGQASGSVFVSAQKQREKELSEKEKGKVLYERKCELLKENVITEDEFYSVMEWEELEKIVDARKRARSPAAEHDNDLNEHWLELLNSGLISQQDLVNNGVPISGNVRSKLSKRLPEDGAVKDDQLKHFLESEILKTNAMTKNETAHVNEEDFSLTEKELKRLLREGGFLDVASLGPSLPDQTSSSSLRAGGNMSDEERFQLVQAGILPPDGISGNLSHLYDCTQHGPPPVNDAHIQSLFHEFISMDIDEKPENPFGKWREHHTYFATRNAPAVPDIYDKRSSMYASLPAQTSKGDFSGLLNAQIGDVNLLSKNFLEDQSRLYVEWMKQAEKFGFTPEELNLASNLNWQDPKGRDPIQWLKEEWTGRIAEVIGKVTERTRSENDCVGNLSTGEAKQALLDNHGSVESACKACIEARREKLAKMGELSVFTRADCLNALDKNNGNMEQALHELETSAMEPLRKRVLGLVGLDDGGMQRAENSFNQAFIAVVMNKNVSFERRVRVLLAEKKVVSWGRGETAVKLVDLGFSAEDSIEAAKAYGDLPRSLGYLRQECPICTDEKPMGQMITFLCCQDRICRDCVAEYLTGRIKERQIHTLVCPVCGLPELNDEMEALDYFNNLDFMVRELVEKSVHDIFQQKLRDRALRKEANFRWCAHCSSGFINGQPGINKMQCPHCMKFSCFSCKKPWEDQHEGLSCEQFARWQQENDEEFQLAGLAGHLARNGIDCPECKFRYDLARGGCMHFKCNQCGHEFCSGCYNPFKQGARCNASETCARRGLHAHHPRDCLFYLRDWEPQRLQGLLQDNGVDFHAQARALNVREHDSDSENDDEIAGAVGGAPQTCKVMEQKDAGMDDVECGRACQPGHDGLCRVHYTEYLVDLINKNGIDPADAMNVEELAITCRREEIEVRALQQGENEDAYRQQIVMMLKRDFPLPQPPDLRAFVEQEQEGEEIDEVEYEVGADEDLP